MNHFGEALAKAIEAGGHNQRWLAENLHVNPTQVSRWVNGNALPRVESVAEMERLLHASLLDVLSMPTSEFELFLSAPITGLGPDSIAAHHEQVGRIVEAVGTHVEGVYWPGHDITSTDDLLAPDLATGRNLQALAECKALLYVQLEEVTHPSGSLIELGIALGRKTKTTIFIKRGLAVPYMLVEGFQGVAANSQILPQARLYVVSDADDAIRTINRNGRELLGLD